MLECQLRDLNGQKYDFMDDPCENTVEWYYSVCASYSPTISPVECDGTCAPNFSPSERPSRTPSLAPIDNWIVSPWSDCNVTEPDATCGEGIQLRSVVCPNYQTSNTCQEDVKPVANQTCTI